MILYFQSRTARWRHKVFLPGATSLVIVPMPRSSTRWAKRAGLAAGYRGEQLVGLGRALEWEVRQAEVYCGVEVAQVVDLV